MSESIKERINSYSKSGQANMVHMLHYFVASSLNPFKAQKTAATIEIRTIDTTVLIDSICAT
jgi:hypothetical protein